MTCWGPAPRRTHFWETVPSLPRSPPATEQIWRWRPLSSRALCDGMVHDLAAAEASGRQELVSHSTSERVGSWPITSCCAACSWSAEPPGRRFGTLARATSRLAASCCAALGRPGALALRRAARARNKSRPGLVALASPCVGARCGMPTQTSSCGSEFTLLDGSKCAALAHWMVPTILASRARQKWVAVLASPAGRGHVVMREGRPRWLCRVARWSNLIKPLQRQLGQHAYCLGTAAQSLWVGFEGIVVWYVQVAVTRCERFIHTYVRTVLAQVKKPYFTF